MIKRRTRWPPSSSLAASANLCACSLGFLARTPFSISRLRSFSLPGSTKFASNCNQNTFFRSYKKTKLWMKVVLEPAWRVKSMRRSIHSLKELIELYYRFFLYFLFILILGFRFYLKACHSVKIDFSSRPFSFAVRNIAILLKLALRVFWFFFSSYVNLHLNSYFKISK